MTHATGVNFKDFLPKYIYPRKGSIVRLNANAGLGGFFSTRKIHPGGRKRVMKFLVYKWLYPRLIYKPRLKRDVIGNGIKSF